MPSVSSFDIISGVLLLPEPKLFLCSPASAAAAAAVNSNGIEILLGKGLIIF